MLSVELPANVGYAFISNYSSGQYKWILVASPYPNNSPPHPVATNGSLSPFVFTLCLRYDNNVTQDPTVGLQFIARRDPSTNLAQLVTLNTNTDYEIPVLHYITIFKAYNMPLPPPFAFNLGVGVNASNTGIGVIISYNIVGFYNLVNPGGQTGFLSGNFHIMLISENQFVYLPNISKVVIDLLEVVNSNPPQIPRVVTIIVPYGSNIYFYQKSFSTEFNNVNPVASYQGVPLILYPSLQDMKILKSNSSPLTIINDPNVWQAIIPLVAEAGSITSQDQAEAFFNAISSCASSVGQCIGCPSDSDSVYNTINQCLSQLSQQSGVQVPYSKAVLGNAWLDFLTALLVPISFFKITTTTISNVNYIGRIFSTLSSGYDLLSSLGALRSLGLLLPPSTALFVGFIADQLSSLLSAFNKSSSGGIAGVKQPILDTVPPIPNFSTRTNSCIPLSVGIFCGQLTLKGGSLNDYVNIPSIVYQSQEVEVQGDNTQNLQRTRTIIVRVRDRLYRFFTIVSLIVATISLIQFIFWILFLISSFLPSTISLQQQNGNTTTTTSTTSTVTQTTENIFQQGIQGIIGAMNSVATTIASALQTAVLLGSIVTTAGLLFEDFVTRVSEKTAERMLPPRRVEVVIRKPISVKIKEPKTYKVEIKRPRTFELRGEYYLKRGKLKERLKGKFK
jgi:hypothetical protein